MLQQGIAQANRTQGLDVRSLDALHCDQNVSPVGCHLSAMMESPDEFTIPDNQVEWMRVERWVGSWLVSSEPRISLSCV